MKTQLSVLLCLCIISLGFSQDQLWQRVDSQKSLGIFTNQTDLPTKTVFTLDQDAMYKALSKAPLQKKGVVSNIIIPFPNADGTLENYNIYESPIMEPKLAKKYPNIKTYRGYSTTTTGIISFSISPKGIQSIRLGHGSSVFIEILSEKNSTYTVSNDMKNIVVSQNCGHGHQYEHEDSPMHITSHQKSAPELKNFDDNQIRTYRLAVSATYEYTQFHKGEETEEEKIKENTIAAINATMTTVNTIYTEEVGIRFMLVDNEKIIYTKPNDPYNLLDSIPKIKTQVQDAIDTNIGSDNYDVGQLFSATNSLLEKDSFGQIESFCEDGNKAKALSSTLNPIGSSYAYLVSHELAHQLGATHTFSFRKQPNNASQMEPGSGSTIMGYAGIARPNDQNVQSLTDGYFHAYSIHQIRTFITDPANCQGIINDVANTPPVVDAGSDYTIPKGTPFVLTASTFEPDGDALSYCWEQIDTEDYIADNFIYGPLFRSLPPQNNINTRNFPSLFQDYGKWEKLPEQGGTLNFRCTVRDGQSNAGDNMTITVDDLAGPFKVTNPKETTKWVPGTRQTITWDVANTDFGAVNVSAVDIFIAPLGAIQQSSFEELALGVPNNGEYTFTVPEDLSPSKLTQIMVKGSNHIFYAVSPSFEVGTTQQVNTPRDLKILGLGQLLSPVLTWKMDTGNDDTLRFYQIFQNGNLIDEVARFNTGLNYTLTNLVEGEAYSYYVKSKTLSGTVSNQSNTLEFTYIPQNTIPVEPACGSVISSTSNSGDFNLGFPQIDGLDGPGTWNTVLDGSGTWFVTESTPEFPAAEGTGFRRVTAQKGTDAQGVLYSPCYFLMANSVNAQLSFQYRMTHPDTELSTLTLQITTDNGKNWSDFWTANGNVENSWAQETLNIDAHIGKLVRFRFIGIAKLPKTDEDEDEDEKIKTIHIGLDDIRFTVINPPVEACQEVRLQLDFDNYSEEISWDLRFSSDPLDQVIASGGNYDGESTTANINIYNCLYRGEYVFTLYDSKNDGFNAPGSYTLTNTTTGEVYVNESAFNKPFSTTVFTITNNPIKTPTGLISSPFGKGDKAIALQWDKPERNPSQYNIYRGLSFDNLESIGQVGGDFLFTIIRELSPETTYYFYITAVDSEGNESNPSDLTRSTTKADIVDTKPNAPTNLTGFSDSSSSIALDWDPPSPNIADHYNVFFADGTFIKEAGADFAFITGLASNTEYTFYVTAVNTAGESDSSNSVTIRTLPPPAKSNNNTIFIIPNPVEDSNHVTVVSSQHIISYAVYDIAGREVRSTTPLPDTKTISLTGIENGMYIVKLQDDKGKTFNQSLIIN